ncbi:MAG: hypothetical protein GX650_04230 [Clostridiales bacterium]|nr:hypothetical protein [Clostridiales bacterium]
MATIPKHIYRACEWQLHNRRQTEKAVREAAQDAIDLVTPGGLAAIVSQGSPGDRTGRAALHLAEGDGAYHRQCQWLDCLERTAAQYEGGPEAEFAGLYYGHQRSIIQVAAMMHYDKQTIYRYRDRYVTYLALLAAERGLIRMTEKGARTR